MFGYWKYRLFTLGRWNANRIYQKQNIKAQAAAAGITPAELTSIEKQLRKSPERKKALHPKLKNGRVLNIPVLGSMYFNRYLSSKTGLGAFELYKRQRYFRKRFIGSEKKLYRAKRLLNKIERPAIYEKMQPFKDYVASKLHRRIGRLSELLDLNKSEYGPDVFIQDGVLALLPRLTRRYSAVNSWSRPGKLPARVAVLDLNDKSLLLQPVDSVRPLGGFHPRSISTLLTQLAGTNVDVRATGFHHELHKGYSWAVIFLEGVKSDLRALNDTTTIKKPFDIAEGIDRLQNALSTADTNYRDRTDEFDTAVADKKVIEFPGSPIGVEADDTRALFDEIITDFVSPRGNANGLHVLSDLTTRRHNSRLQPPKHDFAPLPLEQ